ncbi:MAG: HIRAN domain-containing protein [Steroidobacteraceae bacterium]
MSEQELPSHRTRRISLTKSQLRTELGAELLSLCESVTADGKLAPEEAQGLREWLDEADAAELPAASYLREVVERVLADGQITQEECREVYRAVESVLPPEVRRQATAARREIEVAAREEAKSARDQERAKEREERRRDVQIAAANFMVAGVRHEGRGEVIARYANAGDPVRLVRDTGNRFSRFAIAVQLENGRQIGFVPEEDAQYLAPFLDDGAKCAAWMTKILGRGRTPIPVVQTKLYRADSTVDVEGTSRVSRTLVVDQDDNEPPRERSAPRGRKGSAMRGWLWIAAIIGFLIVVFAS